jgi:hypothetical protein
MAFDILADIESVDSIEAKLGFDVLSKTLIPVRLMIGGRNWSQTCW